MIIHSLEKYLLKFTEPQGAVPSPNFWHRGCLLSGFSKASLRQRVDFVSLCRAISSYSSGVKSCFCVSFQYSSWHKTTNSPYYNENCHLTSWKAETWFHREPLCHGCMAFYAHLSGCWVCFWYQILSFSTLIHGFILASVQTSMNLTKPKIGKGRHIPEPYLLCTALHMCFLSHPRIWKFYSSFPAGAFIKNGNWMDGMIISSNLLETQFSIIITYVCPKSHLYGSACTQTHSINLSVPSTMRSHLKLMNILYHFVQFGQGGQSGTGWPKFGRRPSWHGGHPTVKSGRHMSCQVTFQVGGHEWRYVTPRPQFRFSSRSPS